MLKLASWNVNSIRAAVRHGFADFLKKEKPDVLCLQEIKMDDNARAKAEFSAKGGPASGWDFSGYIEYWFPAKKKGYAGTGMLVSEKSKIKIVNQWNGIEKFSAKGLSASGGDDEGRVQTAEFEKFYLINVYFPHSRHDLSRLNFKLEFDAAILKYMKKLENKKPVIITGDFNVAHTEIDLKNPKSNEENPGFLPRERAWMTKYLKSGFIDTYRLINGDKIQYTWWSYMFNARAKNIGWRIDYFLTSEKLKNKIKEAKILDQVHGSDHCPVSLKIDL